MNICILLLIVILDTVCIQAIEYHHLVGIELILIDFKDSLSKKYLINTIIHTTNNIYSSATFVYYKVSLLMIYSLPLNKPVATEFLNQIPPSNIKHKTGKLCKVFATNKLLLNISCLR